MSYLLALALTALTLLAPAVSEVSGPLTPHFQQWLDANNYSSYNFARTDLPANTSSFGGKQNADDKINRNPIIFVHGNSDGALFIPGPYSWGSSVQIAYFLEHGWTSGELYVTTWGDRRVDTAQYQAHNCSTIARLRAFAHAIMEYTGTKQIDIASHSMGVTLARKMARGGQMTDWDGSVCSLGAPLPVRVFLGLAGANRGMCTCGGPWDRKITCNRLNGFWPGGTEAQNITTCANAPNVAKYSALLMEMNEDGFKEGEKVYSVWSLGDDIIGNQGNVFSAPTCLIPLSDEKFIVQNITHMETKTKTVALQMELLCRDGYCDDIPTTTVVTTSTTNSPTTTTSTGISLLCTILFTVVVLIV